MNPKNTKNYLLLFIFLLPFVSDAQGLISHDFNDGEMGPFVHCTTQSPNYAKVVNNRLRTYWEQTSYSSSRMTKGAEACGDPIHNGVGYLTYKYCWMGFTMNIDEGYMQGDVGVGGLAQIFGFDHARGQSTWTAMLDMKDGDLAWMDRRGSGNTRADVVVYENFPRGVDMDIIIHTVLSDNNTGLVEIFVNGVLKYSAYDIRIGMGEFDENDTQTNESSTEFKIGQYNHSDAAANEIRIVDYDNISWYDGEDGYDIVNPAQNTSACNNTTAFIEAECYDNTSGVTVQPSSAGGENIGDIQNNDWIVYQDIDLSDVYSVKAQVATVKDGVSIEVHIDNIDGELLATIPVTNTGDWQTWLIEHVNIGQVNGVHDVYLLCKGGSGGILNIDWFGFSEDVRCENTTGYTEAECYDDMNGIQTEGCLEGSLNVGWIQNNDWIRYNGFDLTGMNSFKARVSGNTSGSRIEIRTGSETGTLLGQLVVSNTAGNQNWVTDSINIQATSGEHDIYLVFKGGDGYLFNVNWFGFSEEDILVTSVEEQTVPISIYPNPSAGVFNLNKTSDYKVTSALGTEILSETGSQIDLSVYPKGVYYLEVKTIYGVEVYSLLKE